MTLVPGVSSFRAGAADCLCPPDADARAPVLPARELALLSVGAAASVLSQILMYGLLPIAGTMYAPEPALTPVPFVALLIGAVSATFPAAILRDAFGRRAAFALGASLGIAGGLVLAFGLTAASFWPIVLGAFWIGIANGFALQYRHAAVIGVGTGDAARTIGIVIGASALVGLVAPTLSGLFEASLTPAVGAGVALLAAAAHVVALATAMVLPGQNATEPSTLRAVAGRSRFLAATAIAAAAWFGMTAVMVNAPLGLAGCGVGFTGSVGAIAWHVVAMYAPAMAIGFLVARLGATSTAAGGLALVLGALMLTGFSPSVGAIGAGLIAAGAGWSIATSAAVVALHEGAPSRLAIAGHDAIILLAAIGGAFVSLWPTA